MMSSFACDSNKGSDSNEEETKSCDVAEVTQETTNKIADRKSSTARLMTNTDDEITAYDKEDLLKSHSYHFGCGPFHPKWMQVLANKKFFTFLMCLYIIVQGSVITGFTSVNISTLEIRYSFSSTMAGALISVYEMTVIIGIVLITYIGGKLHRPRVLGVCLITLSIGCFVEASPQFIFGKYKGSSASSQALLELCTSSESDSDDCSTANIGAYVILVIGQVLIGLGSTALYTVAIAYIDEIVYPKYVSLHLGAFLVFGVVGPAIGFLLGSFLLTIYVDPWVETELTEANPNWVGAWWLGYLIMGTLGFFISLVLFMFPKWLPDSHLVKAERAKEMAKVFSSKFVNEDPLTLAVKEFPIHIKSLLTNPSYMITTFALATIFIVKEGVVSFGALYIESMFSVPASVAGLLAGGLAITAAASGVATGALIVYFWKPKGRLTAVPQLTIITLSVPFVLMFLFKCPSYNVAGITVPYSDGAFDGKDSSHCSMNCTCLSSVFEPVCGEDGITYFSPCRAGCTGRTESDIDRQMHFDNCSCIFVTNTTANSTAIDGLCPNGCKQLIPFIVALFFLVFLFLMIDVPHYKFTLRVVADDQRHLALGLQSSLYRLFGSLPGPLLFGVIVDLSCVEWEYNCGVRGNCWIYDNDQLSFNAIVLCLPFALVSVVLFILAVIFYPVKPPAITSDTASPE